MTRATMDEVRDTSGTPSIPREHWHGRLAGTGEGGLDATAIIGGLKRHKWMLLLCVIIGTAGMALLSLLLEPRYTATAVVMIEPRQPRLFDDKAAAASALSLEDYAIETQVKVLGARSTVQQVIDSLGLASDPEFNRDLAPQDAASTGPWRRLVAVWRKVFPATAEPSEAASASSDGPAASRWLFQPPATGGAAPPANEATFQRVIDRLTISREGQSGVISVRFSASDPERAARIANTLVDGYVLSQVRVKGEAAWAAGSALMDQVQRLRGQVLEAEKAVEQYRAGHDLVDGSEGSLIDEQLAGMNNELIEARAARIAMETKLEQVRAAAARRNGYRTLPEVVAAPGMVKLLERESELLLQEATMVSTYGEKSPALVELKAQQARLAEKIIQDVANIIRGLEGQAEVARAREQVLEERLTAAKRTSASARGAGLHLRELEREAASRRTVYEAMLLRLREDQEEKGLFRPEARVISAAVAPVAPAFPRLPVMAAIGFIGSALLALALAALREHFQRGLRTGRQIERALKLPLLAMLPRLEDPRKSASTHRYLIEAPRSVFAEGIKSLQLAVKGALLGVATPTVMITSSLPGEGKTTVATSLAVSFARTGSRTVLIDLDLRQPDVGRRFGQEVEADLIQYLRGEETLDDVVLQVPQLANLHYIAVESEVIDPLEFLESEALTGLFAGLRARFDIIIIDTTPTLGVTDPTIIASLADAIVFVVQWQKTNEEVAANGLKMIRRSGAHVAGSVLSQVDVRRHATYGYGDVAEYYGSYPSYFRN